MDQNESTPKRRTGLIIGGFIIVGILIILGLFLPPISLGDRLGLTGSEPEADTAVTDETNPDTETTPTETAVMPDGVALALTSGSADITVEPQSEFLNSNPAAAGSLPEGKSIVSDVYVVTTDDAATGQVALAIPATAGDQKTLDLFGWNNEAWQFIPSQIDPNSQQLVTAEGQLPAALAMTQTAAPESTTIGAITTGDNEIPGEILGLLSEVTVGSLRLDADGTLSGEATKLPDGPYEQWLHVTNVGPIIDQAAVTTLLSNPDLQTSQINAIVEQATTNNFPGVNLDYQNIPVNQADAFTNFTSNLADALHAQNVILAITLGTPSAAGSNWDTGGQDWAALGEIVDVAYVQMPLDPTEFDADDEAAQIVNWATRQINRSKLSTLQNASAVDRIGETFMPLSNETALINFGELQFVEGSNEVAPNATVSVALSGTAAPLEWDGDSLTYKYSYEKDGQTHDVWLGSEAALSHRAQLDSEYNLRGLAVDGLEGAAVTATLNNLKNNGEAPQPTGAAIVWTVRNENESVLASESGSELTYTWDVGDNEGSYTIHADFALGDNIAELDSVDVAVIAGAGEESEEVAETEEPATEEEAETETEEPAAAVPTGETAVVNVGANIRKGPGLTYGILTGGVDPGTVLDLVGRNSDSSWLNIILPSGEEGWIFATLVTPSADVSINNLPVVEVAAPAPVAASSSDDSGSDAGTETPAPAAPPPVAAAPVVNTGFELGGQSHTFGNPQLMDYAGMNWVKFQHKWGPGDDPSAVQGRIDQAHANGFKVLLSMPGATTYPSSIDFQEYVNFLGGVAALGPDAIEVWNEMNIDFEWPAGEIDPTSYVNNMLAPAYNAIKGANPNVMVISGAPAPTGFFGGGCGANGCDDSAYLAGMAAAGAANYMDCMGAHYNAGATSPSATSGHPAGGTHYSWYLPPMIDLYASLGKPVCFTELGYLSGEDFGGVPSRFSWAGNTTVSQHAQWLAEAVSQAANSGRVRMAIIFNVDFTQWGDDPQAGFAMIRPDGSCPSCETLRQVMGQ